MHTRRRSDGSVTAQGEGPIRDRRGTRIGIVVRQRGGARTRLSQRACPINNLVQTDGVTVIDYELAIVMNGRAARNPTFRTPVAKLQRATLIVVSPV